MYVLKSEKSHAMLSHPSPHIYWWGSSNILLDFRDTGQRQRKLLWVWGSHPCSGHQVELISQPNPNQASKGLHFGDGPRKAVTGPLRRFWFCFLYSLHQVLHTHSQDPPEPSLLQAKYPSSDSLSLYAGCSSTSVIFVAPQRNQSSMSMCLFYQVTKQRTQNSGCVSPEVSTEEWSPPMTRWQCYAWWSPGCHWPPFLQGETSLHVMFTSTPRYFFAKRLPSQPAPSLS